MGFLNIVNQLFTRTLKPKHYSLGLPDLSVNIFILLSRFDIELEDFLLTSAQHHPVNLTFGDLNKIPRTNKS